MKASRLSSILNRVGSLSLKHRLLLGGIGASAGLAPFLYHKIAHRSIATRRVAVQIPNLDQEFQGFTIAHVSDLHNAPEFMTQDKDRLFNAVKSCKPDIIAITGDLIDSRNPQIGLALTYLTNLQRIAPTYFVSGNHEVRPLDNGALDAQEALESNYDMLLTPTILSEHRHRIEDTGTTILDNSHTIIERQNAQLLLCGLRDSFGMHHAMYERQILTARNVIETHPKIPAILLAHRPEHAHAYAEAGFNLCLSGHTHAGQIQLPFLGAIWAPNQGFFPEHSHGHYRVSSNNHSEMSLIVSGGLGTSGLPLRLGPRPEIISVTLEPYKELLSTPI